MNIVKQKLEQQEEERNQRRQRAELENNESSDKQEYVYGIADVLLILSDYEHALPQTLVMLKITVTLGVSSATCKRSILLRCV